MKTNLAIVFGVFANVVGCGKMVDQIRGKRSFRDDTNQLAEGPLVQFIEKLQASDNASECDRKFLDVQMKLAKVLDAKQEEIEAFSMALPPTELFNRVKMGPIFVRELRQPKVAEAGWQSYSYDWTIYDNRLRQIQDKPIGQSWVYLDANVRSILSDDQSRIIYEQNMYLTRQDFTVLKDISKALASCLGDATCTSPNYSDAGAKLVASNPYYRSFGSDRNSLGKLKDYLDADLKHKSPHINKSVSVEANGDITLPLDPGPFADAKDQLGKYITDIWSTSGRQLKINWTTVEATPNAYKFVAEDAVGGRSYVSYNSKTIHLFPDVRAKSIAHEIGHVLAFPDYYYTTWHPDTCEYSTDYDEGNLMSSPTEGIVTPEDWQILSEIYPPRP